MKKYLSVVVTAAMAASLVAGCRRGGSGHSASSSGGGGGASSEATALTQLVQSIGMYALVRAGGVINPASISNYSVNCPSGGTVSVNGSAGTAGVSGNTLTVGGSVAATFNSCVSQGITIGGSWTEAFSFTDVFSPSISSPSSFTMNGSLSVGPSTVTLTPGGSCAVNFSETINSLSVNYNTYAITGSISYTGTICGTTVSGSCNMATSTCS